MAGITTLSDEAWIALDNLQDSAAKLFSPTLRLGVTGLSRAGKTVFITALVHNLTRGGRLPLFEAWSSGRIAAAGLQPQPSMDLPRFAYEQHIRTLVEERGWPESTRAISELRLTIRYESASAWSRRFGAGTLNVDIVDYPGEWLLDLPLLAMGYGFDESSGHVTRFSGDGGIDGLVHEDKLGLSTIYIQAKRYTETSVGRPEVQQFLGALTGAGATKGVFITSAGFSREARDFAMRLQNQKVALIDGAQLARLMVEHGVGVATAKTLAIQHVDSDYFDAGWDKP